jgi:hypothetical protein
MRLISGLGGISPDGLVRGLRNVVALISIVLEVLLAIYRIVQSKQE